MSFSPVLLFPVGYIGFAILLTVGVVARWRAGRVHVWQLVLTTLTKVAPLFAFGYALWWGITRHDEVGGYLMFAIAALAATVLGVGWLLYDTLVLGAFRRT